MPDFDAILESETAVLCEKHPGVCAFLRDQGIALTPSETGLKHWLDALPEARYEDIGIGKERLLENLRAFCGGASPSVRRVESVTIVGGRDKKGAPERFEIVLETGSITSLVGATGSGKSRLLADIEWMAQGDTPTGRTILINGRAPDPALRFQPEHKLVAQLSQNMNFVLDASVAEFIGMHAQARGLENTEKIRTDIIERANALAGEAFGAHTPLTSLSGGQSRALMIADTAFLSASAIVLIDEIENAGIDRQKALELLTRMDKIVLMATHDPILALMAQRRLVIAEGGIQKVLETSAAEKSLLLRLEAEDKKFADIRRRLRDGETLELGVL